jgi:hypothetical protein
MLSGQWHLHHGVIHNVPGAHASSACTHPAAVHVRHCFFLQDMASGQWHLHHGVIDKVPGAAPNDPASFQLRDHFSVAVAQGQL